MGGVVEEGILCSGLPALDCNCSGSHSGSGGAVFAGEAGVLVEVGAKGTRSLSLDVLISLCQAQLGAVLQVRQGNGSGL